MRLEIYLPQTGISTHAAPATDLWRANGLITYSDAVGFNQYNGGRTLSFEPQKFFIGLVDFFAIILPGALLTFLVKDKLGEYLLGWHYGELTGPPGWVAFLGASYLLGHFVFLIGSWVMDDFTYDPMRKASYGEQISELAKGEHLSPVVWRSAATG